MLRSPLVTLSSSSSSTSSGLSGNHGPHSSAFFTFEKQAASLNDLDIVRKIVEREGCIEALSQLLSGNNKTKASEPSTSEIEQTYPYTYPRRSILNSTNTRGSTASPMVVQSLLDQLRSVSVQIVEVIEQWRATNQLQVFQWRHLNYLLKMTSDLDFLASVPVQVDALQQLPRLTRNPFLAPLHLDHAALREKVPDQALQMGVFIGNVDMERVFFASKVLLRELETEKKKQQMQQQGVDEDSDEYDNGLVSGLNTTISMVDPSLTTALKHQPPKPQSSTAMHMRWSNQDVKTLSSTLGRDTSSDTRLPQPSRESRGDEMSRDLELNRELIFHAEHELGAIREEVAILQTQLQESLARPERRRKLQNKIGALVNALKFKSGDLYQRKNELRRKEAMFKLACERTGGGMGKSGTRFEKPGDSFTSSSGGHMAGDIESDGRLRPPKSQQPHAYLSCVESVMQEDELRRQDIVEKFATLARMRAATSSSTSRNKHKQQLLTPSGQSSGPFKPSVLCNSRLESGSRRQQKLLSLQEMAVDDVALFLDGLDLGYSYGDKFRAQGIDGALLAQATDQDLEEVGVALRLHRVRILEAIESLRLPLQSTN